MNFADLFDRFKQKAMDIRPFLRTKIGSRLGLLFIADFILLFFAPMLQGFVGTALVGCVASVYLILMWRRYDREHVIVPAVLLCIPMLLDMPIYHNLSVIVGLLVAMVAMFIAAVSPWIGFFDKIGDLLYTLLSAGAICVAVVVAACILLFIVQISWWILCIIAFLIVVAVFLGVVFSTAAYTASDGRRQAAKKRREQIEDEQQRRYEEYRPRRRDNKIYNLDEDDFTDIE